MSAKPKLAIVEDKRPAKAAKKLTKREAEDRIRQYEICRSLNHHWAKIGSVIVKGSNYVILCECSTCEGRRLTTINRYGRLVGHDYHLPTDYHTPGRSISKAESRRLIFVEAAKGGGK